VNSNLGTSPPDGTTTGVALAQLNAPSVTIMLFEVSGITWNASSTAGETGQSASAGNGIAVWANCGWSGSDAGALNMDDGIVSAFYETGVFGNIVGESTPSAPFDKLTGRHTQGANYLFADSHVKWLRATSVSAGANNLTANDPGSGSGASLVAANTGYSGGAVQATFSMK
jgi:prepilin-type processing-associated H-X9-DG protein